jgi:hypothetical protein
MSQVATNQAAFVPFTSTQIVPNVESWVLKRGKLAGAIQYGLRKFVQLRKSLIA